MSISFIAASLSSEGSKNVGPKPVGAVEDDFMLALVWAYEEEVTAAPSGWTLEEQWAANDVQGQPEDFNAYLYTKFAGASEPSSYTWVTTTSTGPTPNRRVEIAAYRGVWMSDPIADKRAGVTENGGVGYENPDTLEIPDTFIEIRPRMVILAAVGTTSPTATMPSPFVQRLDQQGNFIFDRIIPAGQSSVETSVLTLPGAMTSWGIGVMLTAAPEVAGVRFDCSLIDVDIN